MNDFGVKVKEYIKNNNISQNQIADTLGVKKAAVSNLLSRDNISLDKMQAIASALDCKLIIDLVPNEEKSK